MKLSSTSIREFFVKLRSSGRGTSDHGIIHPSREWFGSLVAGLILVALGSGWATHMYWHYDDMVKNPFSVEEATDPTYREAMVSQALAVLEDRKQQYEKIERRLRGEDIEASSYVLPVIIPATTSTTSVGEVVSNAPATSTELDTEEIPVGAIEVSN